MKINISLGHLLAESDETKNSGFIEANVPEIDINRVKKLTMNKIQQNQKNRPVPLGNNRIKAACALIAAVLITTGSVYAFGNEGFQALISQLTGVQQAKVLTVGEAISNRDYKLKVHEIVTDSYIGDVVISVEALRDKSKEAFGSYRIDLKHIGSGYGLRELEEYREAYIKYYKISFAGATHKDSYNGGKLQFSVEGMEKAVEVPLTPTVERIDMDIPEDNSNGYKYKFDRLHVSEIGLTLEGADTRNTDCEYLYNIELLLSDGTRELLQKKMNEEDIDTHIPDNAANPPGEVKISDDGTKSISQNAKAVTGKTVSDTSVSGGLIGGGSFRSSGDDDDYVNLSLSFTKTLPLAAIKQVIINDIAYVIER